MLKKLLKYEFLATGRMLLPVGAGMLGLSALGALLLRLWVWMPTLRSQGWYELLTALVTVLLALALIAALLACVFINVQRFYKLLGEQGYLMLTLPVTTHQHLAAKLICAIAETAAYGVLVFVCSWLLLLGAGETGELRASFSELFTETGVLPGFFYLLLVVLLGLAGGYLFFYLCIAIGGQWPQQRLLASVVAYFVVQFVLQIVVVMVVGTVGVSVALNQDLQATLASLSLTPSSQSVLAGGLLTVFVLVLLAWDVALWFITHHLMTKKLNLA